MQSRVELLPPSHFTLIPPSSFGENSSDGRTAPKSAAVADDSRRSRHRLVGERDAAGQSRFAETKFPLQPTAGVVRHTASHSGTYRTRREAPKSVARRRECGDAAGKLQTRRDREFATAKSCSHEDRKPTSEHYSEESETVAKEWLPRKPDHVAVPAATGTTGSEELRTRQGYRGSPARDVAVRVESNTQQGWKKECGTLGSTGAVNVEESLARSLARCQKIDKSLEFYADLRKRWREPGDDSGRHHTATSNHNSSQTESSRGHAHACAESTTTPGTTPHSARGKRAYGKSLSASGGVTGEDCSQRRSSETSDPVKRPSKGGGKRTSSVQRVGYAPVLNDLSNLYPERRKKRSEGNSSSPALSQSPSAERDSGKATPTEPAEAEKEAEKVSSEKTPSVPADISGSTVASSVTSATPPVTLPPLSPEPAVPPTKEEVEKEEEEEEFNDFDSVQQDSDSEPLSGTFGKPVLTGARPIASPELVAAGDERSESEGAVCEKKFSHTHSDTVLARILQAEEESRAGVSLERKLHLYEHTLGQIRVS